MPPDEVPPRYRPKYDPRTPDEEYDGSHYGVTGGPADPDPEPPADAPRKRKKKPRPAGFGELDPKYHDKLTDLDPPPDGPPAKWWVPAAAVGGAGVVIGLAFQILLLTRLKDGSAGVAAAVVVGGLILEVAEVGGLTVFLMMFGHLCGIDYGPVGQSVAKIAAVATLVNGLTLAILVGCSPFLVPVAAVVGIAAFQGLFRLSVTEAFLTGGALGGLSIFVNLIVLATVLKFLLA